jgi:hypothetical protein
MCVWNLVLHSEGDMSVETEIVSEVFVRKRQKVTEE